MTLASMVTFVLLHAHTINRRRFINSHKLLSRSTHLYNPHLDNRHGCQQGGFPTSVGTTPMGKPPLGNPLG